MTTIYAPLSIKNQRAADASQIRGAAQTVDNYDGLSQIPSYILSDRIRAKLRDTGQTYELQGATYQQGSDLWTGGAWVEIVDAGEEQLAAQAQRLNQAEATLAPLSASIRPVNYDGKSHIFVARDSEGRDVMLGWYDTRVNGWVFPFVDVSTQSVTMGGAGVRKGSIPNRSHVMTGMNADGQEVMLAWHDALEEQWVFPTVSSDNVKAKSVTGETFAAGTVTAGVVVAGSSRIMGQRLGKYDLAVLDATGERIVRGYSHGANTLTDRRQTTLPGEIILTDDEDQAFGVVLSLDEYNDLRRVQALRLTSPYQGLENLRAWADQKGRRYAGFPDQTRVAWIGDSRSRYSHYISPVTKGLRGFFGDAGPGWVAQQVPGEYNRVSAVIDTEAPFLSEVQSAAPGAGWTPRSSILPSPTTAYLQSSTSNEPLTYVFPSGLTNCYQHFLHTTDGVIRYRWQAEGEAYTDWFTANVSGGPVNSRGRVALTGIPATAGTLTLQIECHAGTVKPSGLQPETGRNGVVVHNLGLSGSAIEQWVQVDASQWAAGLLTLNPHLVVINLGTNDQASAARFGAWVRELITRVRSVLPAADILLIASQEHFFAAVPHTYKMGGYANELRTIAAELACGLIDLTVALGQPGVDYGSDLVAAKYNDLPDGIHEGFFFGGPKVASCILKALL